MTVCLSAGGESVTRSIERPDHLLVGTSGGVFLLRRSQGDPYWVVSRAGLDRQHVSAIVPAPGGRIVASVHRGGIYHSDDGGRHWAQAARGISATAHVYSLAVAGEGARVTLYAGTEPASLFRSEDLGETWTELPALGRMKGSEKWTCPPPPHVAHVKSVTIDARDAARIYAAVEQGGLFESRDRGESRVELDAYYRSSDPVYRDIHRVVQVPWNLDLFFMATGMGLYRSRDSGIHWERLASLDGLVGYPDCLIVVPTGRIVFVSGPKQNPSHWMRNGGAFGLAFRSHNEGTSWEPANAGLPERMRGNIEGAALAIHEGGQTLFAGTTEGEVFASDDAAAHWTRIAQGLPAVSKGAHYQLIRTASSIPAWLRPVASAVGTIVMSASERRAAARRMRSRQPEGSDPSR
jgi:photosystem II stability/assembly factor-like uncharacterized protein